VVNFFLIYGTNKTILDREISNILSSLKLASDNVIKYNLEDCLLTEVIEDAATVSLFGDKKVIIVKNSDFFSKNGEEIEILDKYLDHFNSNNYIIFISNLTSLDSRKKIIKKLSEKGKIIELKNDKDYLYNYALEYIKNNEFSINNFDLSYFLSKVGTNINNVTNELDKLFLLKKDNIILREDIENNVMKNYEDEIYALTEVVVKNDVEKSLELYHDFVNKNYEEVQMIAMLANQFRLLFQVKRLSNKDLNNDEISKILKVHPYRVKLARDINYQFTENDLLKYIGKLSKLDSDIKTGTIDKSLGLELFLINKDL